MPPSGPSETSPLPFSARIALRCLQAWAGECGRREGALLFVQGFVERARGDVDLAVRAARHLEAVRRRGIAGETLLLARDPRVPAEVRDALEAAGIAVREAEAETEGAGPESAGGARVSHAAFPDVAEAVAARAAASSATLCFLDPPGPRHLPLTALRALLAREGTDLLLRFPHEELEALERYRHTPFADLPPYPRRVLEGYSAMLGDGGHRWTQGWREAGPGEGGREAVVRCYRDALAGAAEGWTVKRLPPAPSAEAHLFFLTRSPRRALSLNQQLEAEGVEAESPFVRWEEEPAALELFTARGARAVHRARRVDLAGLAHGLAGEYRERTLPYDGILSDLAETALHPEEVRRALGMLRREGRVVYRTLRGEAEIWFPPRPVAPSAHRARGRRSEPDLFGQGGAPDGLDGTGAGE